MKLSILTSGLTLIQDAGRIGFELVGVSRSGAWDNAGYRLATSLVGEEGSPCFEILRGKLSLSCDLEALFAVVGEATVTVDGKIGSTSTALLLEPGSILGIEPKTASPVYLGIAGLRVTKTLGSASTDTLSGLGPNLVQAGDEFQIEQATSLDSLVGSFIQSRPRHGSAFHFIPGPHQIDIAGNFEVSAVSRTGIRLSSSGSLGSGTLESFPVLPGSIQITPSGEPVILGPDAGTTGGYPVAGTIIEAELDYLSHLQQGSRIQLMPITLEQAKAKSDALKQYLAQAVIRPSNMGAW